LARPPADLHVQPADIHFRNVANDRLRISIVVSNHGLVRSQPIALTIQAAPLGAFLSWKSITTLAVPAIEPLGQAEISVEVASPTPKPLGQFSRVPPRRLITALAQDDPQPEPATAPGLAGVLNRLLGRTLPQPEQPNMPDDPMQLVGRPNIHWAGNINILLNGREVERHLAQALRIYPARTNLAMFILGDRRDDYRFELSGIGAEWNAALYDFTDRSTLTDTRSPADIIPQRQWIRFKPYRMIMLAVCPPADCQSGSLDVHVRQRSTGKTATVEFTFDAQASGPGCYTV
jgi:hypothetical protein